jgi:hypothetical protein
MAWRNKKRKPLIVAYRSIESLSTLPGLSDVFMVCASLNNDVSLLASMSHLWATTRGISLPVTNFLFVSCDCDSSALECGIKCYVWYDNVQNKTLSMQMALPCIEQCIASFFAFLANSNPKFKQD